MPQKIERAVIEVNGGCNYSCSMCPQDARTGGRDKRFLSKMTLGEFEETVAELTRHGVKVVNLEGSGEPTLNNNLPEYIKTVKKYGVKAYAFSNGFRMRGRFMEECVDAGLDLYRVSIIGSNRESYSKWMFNSTGGKFEAVLNNIREMGEYIGETGSGCVLCTYHLLTGPGPGELEEYKALAEELGVATEIWKMHNWSGLYDNADKRKGGLKTCGRPFSNDIVIRAGGLDGKRGAVAPCCQVLGRDEEAVLGHVSENSIEEIWNGEEYSDLRERHRTGDWPGYCKDCDFLIDDPTVLVYTNHEDIELHKMHGVDFSLDEHRR